MAITLQKIKEHAVSHVRGLALSFVFMWLFLSAFALYKATLLGSHGIEYHQGFAVAKALVLAKALQHGERFGIGGRVGERPLIYSIILKALVFTLFLMVLVSAHPG
ncbi:MAG TPA: hypothetical protein VKI44_44080 [Acetobacteraceae bacterium]|nr:hypothetical protein [Acetobacteraceae bacterium]